MVFKKLTKLVYRFYDVQCFIEALCVECWQIFGCFFSALLSFFFVILLVRQIFCVHTINRAWDAAARRSCLFRKERVFYRTMCAVHLHANDMTASGTHMRLCWGAWVEHSSSFADEWMWCIGGSNNKRPERRDRRITRPKTILHVPMRTAHEKLLAFSGMCN